VIHKVGIKRRFLIVRHRNYRRFFFDIVSRWVSVNLPSLESWFEVRDLPVRVKDWSRYALHVPWLQDPVQRWSMTTYTQALDLTEKCDQLGIPVVNRVDRLLNATKFRGAQLMQAAGVRVPRMALIQNTKAFEQDLHGLSLPLFIREDWGHERNVVRIDHPSDLSLVPWESFQRPLAVELTDVHDPHDGLFRKYRYVATGDVGVSHHLHVSQEWITRGDNRVINPETRTEELTYISQPDPNHEALQQARRALGLDLLAFDYGYAPDGQMIVWEANPFPHFLFARKRLPYKNPAMHRTMLAIVHLYFSAAGLPIPAAVADGLQLNFADIEPQFKIVRKTNLLDRLKAYPHAFPKWPA
jgi:hypothetical protein